MEKHTRKTASLYTKGIKGKGSRKKIWTDFYETKKKITEAKRALPDDQITKMWLNITGLGASAINKTMDNYNCYMCEIEWDRKK